MSQKGFCGVFRNPDPGVTASQDGASREGCKGERAQGRSVQAVGLRRVRKAKKGRQGSQKFPGASQEGPRGSQGGPRGVPGGSQGAQRR